MGFVEQFGFRNGYAGPFQLYNFKENRAFRVVEIPLYFMDATLVDYMKRLGWQAKLDVVNEVEKLLKNFNCKFSVLFHNSAFASEKYNGFEKMYVKLAALSKRYSN